MNSACRFSLIQVIKHSVFQHKLLQNTAFPVATYLFSLRAKKQLETPAIINNSWNTWSMMCCTIVLRSNFLNFYWTKSNVFDFFIKSILCYINFVVNFLFFYSIILFNFTMSPWNIEMLYKRYNQHVTRKKWMGILESPYNISHELNKVVSPLTIWTPSMMVLF